MKKVQKNIFITGASSGLGIADIVTIIGKEEFASRIDKIKAALC